MHDTTAKKKIFGEHVEQNFRFIYSFMSLSRADIISAYAKAVHVMYVLVDQLTLHLKGRRVLGKCFKIESRHLQMFTTNPLTSSMLLLLIASESRREQTAGFSRAETIVMRAVMSRRSTAII